MFDTIMFNLPCVLILATPIIIGICCHIRRDRARAWADQVIAGNRQATVTEINKYITTILSMHNGLFGRSEQDQQRIDQLRNIRNELTTEHS